MTDLSRRLPPLGTLVVFDAAFRLRSFSKAADECALSQASVSRQMRVLEENVGTRLFKRMRHSVVPTAAGETFALSVRQALLQLADTTSELRTQAAGQNNFRIYSDISIASSILSPLLGQLQRKHPDVNFHIHSTYEPIEKTSTSFDIGFQVGVRASNMFDVKPIGDDLVYPVCSPEFARTHGKNPAPAEIATLPLLHLEATDKDWPDWRKFLATFRIREPAPVEGLVFSSYQIILDVAEQGEGIALGWHRTVHNRIADGKLVRLSTLEIHQPNGICVYQRKNAQTNPLARSTIKEIRSSIAPIYPDANRES